MNVFETTLECMWLEMKFSVELGTMDWMCLGNFIKGDEWFNKKKERIIERDGWLWLMEWMRFNSWKSGALSFSLVLGLMLLFMLLCAFGMTLEMVIVPSRI